MANNLSAYQIFWVEFRATKGIVTKHDAKRLLKYYHNDFRNGDRIHEHFPSEQAAREYLQTHDFSGLDKKYEVRLCSDKQFGMATTQGRSTIITFTTKQESEMYTI